MRHPFWIVNSSLLLLLLLTASMLYLLRMPIPQKESITPTATTTGKKSAAAFTVNISKIYEHDLFDTYQKEEPQVVAASVPEVPESPQPIVATTPKPPEPLFVDPLDVVLRGISIISTEESKNRAVIEDTKTGTEKMYKIGDFVYDAQLIRIFNNKIILLRSNGQQEVLYVRETDAKTDPVYVSVGGWQDVAHFQENGTIAVVRQEFVSRVKNLAAFLDLLDLTTAYKDGVSMGCRIGIVESNSLAYQLGLRPSDIIISVNDIPTALTQDRVKIFKTITNLSDEQPFRVSLIRNGKEYTLTYIIETKQGLKKEAILAEKSSEEQERKDKEIMSQKHQFAPTIDEIRKREKELMMHKGKVPHAPMPAPATPKLAE